MYISGKILVRVDAVDFEQTAIEQAAAVSGMPETVQAMIAARAGQDFKDMDKICQRNQQELHYDIAYKVGDEWFVQFLIKAKPIELGGGAIGARKNG